MLYFYLLHWCVYIFSSFYPPPVLSMILRLLSYQVLEGLQHHQNGELFSKETIFKDKFIQEMARDVKRQRCTKYPYVQYEGLTWVYILVAQSTKYCCCIRVHTRTSVRYEVRTTSGMIEGPLYIPILR